MEKYVIKKNDMLFFVLILIMVLYTIHRSPIFGILFMLLLMIYTFDCLKSKYNLFTLMFFTLMLQIASKNYTDGVIYTVIGYFDEFITVIFGCYVFASIFLKKIKMEKFEIRIMCLYSLLLALSLFSNLYFKTQEIIPIVVDIITYLKMINMYLFARIFYLKSCNQTDNITGAMITKCRFLAVLLFALTVMNIIFPELYPQYDYRIFMNSIQLFFSHPTYLASVSIIILIILLSFDDKKNTVYVIMLILVTVFTFRTKALASVFAIMCLYFGYYKLKLHFKILWGIVVVLFGIWISFDAIKFYYFNSFSDDIIRSRMSVDSIEIANDNFPMGSGFATFGSSAAYQFNSPLYYELGYFSGDYKHAAMADVFWPIVIAQSGWIGAGLFLLIILTFIAFIIRNSEDNSLLFVVSISIFVYEIISSVAETSFFNPMVSCYFLLLGIFVSKMLQLKQTEGDVNENINN